MSDREPAPLRGHSEAGVIVATPGVVSGRPRLAGTRISTACCWSFHKAGYSVGQILGEYPDLTRVDVLAAIAFHQGRRWRKVRRIERVVTGGAV